MHRSDYSPMTSTPSSPSPDPVTTTSKSLDETMPQATTGVAGRTNYAQWDQVTRTLVQATEQEEEMEKVQAQAQLGLNKYARSQAEAEERLKAQQVKQVKKKLQKLESIKTETMQSFPGLLGPPPGSTDAQEEKSSGPRTVRLTRDHVDAGKRVLTLCDTAGASATQDTIVLTQDLSHLESKMAADALTMKPKSYPDDAENQAPEEAKSTESPSTQMRSVFGLIKLNLVNVHHCTILVKCKIISGTVEMHRCSHVTLRIESEATVPTLQVDLSQHVTVEFRDAPSGQNGGVTGAKKLYWGDDANDRIFHAGVEQLHVRLIRDDMIEAEVTADYLRDGAEAVGNATAEECQFVTSVVEGSLITEKVVRAGSTTGKNARAMTQRELQAEQVRRERAAELAVAMADDMIQIKDKHGQILASKAPTTTTSEEEATAGKDNKDGDDDVVEEVYTSMSSDQIKEVLEECELNKKRGNEAFAAGEYAQAILLYSLALDKAEELPDRDSPRDKKKLLARDVLYSNRAACFLKLGQHEKAEQDAQRALDLNPDNIKANFRRGMALHAMGRYHEALPVLAQAYKKEPHNKQIQQALQFCEVRLAQEERKRLES